MIDLPQKEKEFINLIENHSRLINQICYFYSTTQNPFEDLRQEVYINIWRGIEKFRGESKISTYIYRIALNSVLMALRTSKTKIETVPIDLELNLSMSFDDDQKEKLELMYRLINNLDDIEKAIILLWLDETSYHEIATIVGITPENVATRIYRIKKKLSNSL
ncbi:MAG: sigma-70 family RNA polymerase sigma factor [Muribaculaceae bacterium]|nr:sigma-70 family RNA polymerase sigma factor [Muribaculaceae bacterium]